MLWEVEILPPNQNKDTESPRHFAEYALLAGRPAPDDLGMLSSRGYLLEGNLSQDDVSRFADQLLCDRLVEDWVTNPIPLNEGQPNVLFWTVLLKPGVMDPVAQSVLNAARDLGIKLTAVQTFRRYSFNQKSLPEGCDKVFARVLANDAIERIVAGHLHPDHLTFGEPYTFRLVTVPIRDLDDAGLVKLSKDGQLSLSLDEMHTIRDHFRNLQRDPTDVELETVAQTWSEHCSHKTLKGIIECEGTRYENLLKETIFGATQEIRKRLGKDDWCISVFEDNAGVVTFDDQFHVCFKVETHNHPSAIEPYGGANTGIGGVIRDPMGTGMGAKPICNTDVFASRRPIRRLTRCLRASCIRRR